MKEFLSCLPRVRRLWSVLLAVCAVGSSTSAFGLTQGLPCSYTGSTAFGPRHPQATDSIEFYINLFPTYVPPYVIFATTTTILPSHQILFDVVMALDTQSALFPGYQLYNVTISSFSDTITGALGSFPPGDYTTMTTVRIYDAQNGFITPCNPRAGSFTVYPDDGLAPVVEYYAPALEHYFLTQDTDEVAGLDAGAHPGWIRTGQSFLAYRPGQGGGPNVRRFYGLPSAGLDTHFFTNNMADYFYLYVGPKAAAWIQESYDAFELDFPSVADGSCLPGELPVYRLWNQRVDSNHRYTTDPAIRTQMIAKGYVAEGYGPDGVEMCAFTRQAP